MADEDVIGCKLLVRALNPNSKFVVEFEFHKVDLGKKKIKLNTIPTIPPIKGSGLGNLAKLDSSIYIVGDIYKPDELMKQLKELEQEDDDDDDKGKDIFIHCGSSRWCLVSKRWEALKLPFGKHLWPNPATISGNLYCFGSPDLLPKVWNGNDNDWKDLDLPSHLNGRNVSIPVIVDHKKNRALVHFSDSGQIYAFYPNSNSNSNWRCLVENFNRIWHPAVAVSDNILFMNYPGLVDLIDAYDLTTNQRLQIEADFSRVDKTPSEFDAMFTLPGKDVLCLAGQWGCAPTRPASVHFLSFSFSLNHTSDTNVLKLTALDYQCYDIPGSCDVLDFLLL